MDAYSSTIPSALQYGVHIGTWTNWSRGPILGATLTLTRDNGNLLIAFTAFFIGWVSSRFWRVVCLAFHRLYSTPEPRDALHHQRQAILRNSATPESGFWVFSQLYWAWCRSGSATYSLLRTLPVILSAVFCICAFAVTSGFSSRVSTGIGNEVLIDGTNCGLIELAAAASFESIALRTVNVARLANNAANYAQQCYLFNSSGSGMFDCTSFVENRLPATINDQAPCPFKNGICRSNNSNLLLDTGYIDSHEHLGLNAPENERIQIRNVYQCAPLRTTGYTSNVVGLGQNYTRYHYGSALRGSKNNRTLYNYTFEVESLSSQYSRQTDNFQRNYGANFLLA